MGVLNPITFVTGPLGCGKSYFAQKQVMEYLGAGKVVVTNFSLLGDWWEVARRQSKRSRRLEGNAKVAWWEDCISRAYRYDVMDDLYDFVPPGSGEDRGLLVLDEGGLNMNSRLYSLRQKKDKDLHDNPIKSLQFYINMRKRGWTCLILAHDAGHVDNQVQSMGGGIVKLRNYARVKIPWVGIPVAKHPKFNARFFTPDISATIPEFRQFYGLDKRIAGSYRSEQEFEFDPVSLGVRPQRETGLRGRAVDGLDTEELRRSMGRGSRREEGSPVQETPPAVRHRRLRRLVLRILSPRSARTPSITGPAKLHAGDLLPSSKTKAPALTGARKANG